MLVQEAAYDDTLEHNFPAVFEAARDKIALFGGLDQRQLDLILPYLKFASLDQGECVFKQGQLPGNIFILLTGEVQLRIARDDGRVACVDYAPGDCFGETSFIGIQPQLGSAFVTKDAQVIVLSQTCLSQVAVYDSGLFGILMMNLAREISRRFHSSLTENVIY